MTDTHVPPPTSRKGFPRRLWDFFLSFSPYEWVFACTVLLFCIQFAVLPRQTFFSPDEGMRVIASRSLRADSLLSSLIRYQGAPIDTQMKFVPYFAAWFNVLPGPELRLNYSHILYGTLLAPFVALGGVNGAQVLSLLCSTFMGLCAAGILQRVAGRGTAILGVLCVMLLLPSALYAFLVWEHTLTLALFLLAIWCYLLWRDKAHPLLLILGALSLLICCILRIEMVFVIAPLFIWAYGPLALNRRRVWVIAALLLVMAVIYGLLTLYTPQRLPRLTAAFDALWLQRVDKAIRSFVAGYEATDATFFGLLAGAIIGNIALWAVRYRRTAAALLAATALLLVSAIDALALLNIAPFGVSNPGLLGSAPFLLAAFLIPGTPRSPLRLLRWGLLTVFAGYIAGSLVFTSLAFRAASVMSQTGSTWASRYFLALYPLAGIVALETLHAWLGQPTQRWAKGLLCIAIGLSFSVGIMGNLMGLSRIALDKQIITAGCQPIWQAGVQVVITDDWWRAEECAADANQSYLLVTHSNQLAALSEALWQKGTHDVLFVSRDGTLPLQTLEDTLSQCFSFKVVDNINDQFGVLTAKITLEKRQSVCP
jgi:hypothetical protein